MKKYFPILLSKAGEITALKNLEQTVKNEIAPIIQVLPDAYERIENFASEHWTFIGNQLFLDFSLSIPLNNTRIRNTITNLSENGVNAIPVLQNNSHTNYINLVNSLINDGTISNVCIRISNASGGFLNINAQILNMLDRISADRNHVSILLDYGYINSDNYNTIATIATNNIAEINNANKYHNIIIASSSFLENLGSLTPANKLYRRQRYEWNIWQTINSQLGLNGTVKYGDFGIKHPYYTQANFQGSCSIKYTLPNEFIIYRGEISSNHQQGNGQYIIFANRLIRSTDYSGVNFSWGDNRIDFYAHQNLRDHRRKTGNAKSWVEIGQNHHITMLHSIL